LFASKGGELSNARKMSEQGVYDFFNQIMTQHPKSQLLLSSETCIAGVAGQGQNIGFTLIAPFFCPFFLSIFKQADVCHTTATESACCRDQGSRAESAAGQSDLAE
jgi:hypothetical protein